MVKKRYSKTGIKHDARSYEYHRAYYHLYQKPFNGKKDNWIEGRYFCPLCNSPRRLSAFKAVKRPIFKVIRPHIGSKGFLWSNPDFTDVRVQSIHKSYIATLVARCREFLAMYDPDFRDLLRSQEIRRDVGSGLSLPSFSSYQNQMRLGTSIKANSVAVIHTPEVIRR